MSDKSDKWYPGKFLGKKKSSRSSEAKVDSVEAKKTHDSDKWYPGKFVGRENPESSDDAKSSGPNKSGDFKSNSTYQITENNEKYEIDSHILSIRRGKMPGSPVGTVHLRLHGSRYIEAAKPIVKIQLKEQSETYSGDDYSLETAFLFDCPTSDIIISVYDKFAVGGRGGSEHGAIIGQVVLPLVHFMTVKDLKKPAPQWYELFPPSRALSQFGQYRATVPLTRTRIEPLGFLCISAGLHINRDIPNVFMLYFQGSEHHPPPAQQLLAHFRSQLLAGEGAGSAAALLAADCADSKGAEEKSSSSSRRRESLGAPAANAFLSNAAVLAPNGPVDLMTQAVTRLKLMQVVLPFNVCDIGPLPIAVLCIVYLFACLSIAAWEIPLYLFVMVAVLGGAATMTKSSNNIAVFSEFSRESAAAAAATANQYAVVQQHSTQRSGGDARANASAGAPTSADSADSRLGLLRDFLFVVESFDAFVSNLEKFANLWNFLDARVSVVAYASLFIVCVVSSVVISFLGVHMLVFLGGSMILVVSYLVHNAGLTNEIDALIVEAEEDIRRTMSMSSADATQGTTARAKAAATLKERAILWWKRMQLGYHCLCVFWSRVPTRYDVEHRHMAGKAAVVEDGREMMDAAQFAASNGSGGASASLGSSASADGSSSDRRSNSVGSKKNN